MSRPLLKPSKTRWTVDRLARLWGRAVQTGRLMVGIPDYGTYVAHRRTHHPGEPVMSYPEFFRERQKARYGGEGGRISGCC